MLFNRKFLPNRIFGNKKEIQDLPTDKTATEMLYFKRHMYFTQKGDCFP